MKLNKKNIYEIIFEADSRKGKIFDVSLLILIILSIIIVMIESVQGMMQEYSTLLTALEWGLTIIFSIEYILRIIIVRNAWRYIFSFYGIIDLLAILPGYLSLFVGGTSSLIVIRSLRLLRTFRILKLTKYISEGVGIIAALKASRAKIVVFMYFVITVVVIIGTAMYLIEGETNGFDNIPNSIYWAVVTLTTVGYGDIAPQTYLGRFIAGFIMILGYAVIAVPTGIVSVEIAQNLKSKPTTQVCPACLEEGHEHDAIYCKYCGSQLNENDSSLETNT